MNRDEAKRSLRAFRPTEPDHQDPAFTEALDLVREDPELARWLEDEVAFDQELSGHLADAPIPADLRDRILSRKPAAESAPTTRSSFRHSLALFAACVAVILGIAAFWNHTHRPPTLDEWQTGSLAALSQILQGHGKLDQESPDSQSLRQWLTDAHSPVPQSLPRSLDHADSVGCKKLVFGNQQVSIICFHATPTQLAHLVTVDARALSHAPPEHAPQFVRNGDWVTASWSDRGQAFMLAMKGGEEELRRLLAAG